MPRIGGIGTAAQQTAGFEAWARDNLVRPGEHLAGVSISPKVHPDTMVVRAILHHAVANGVLPADVRGSMAAGTPICTGCQDFAAKTLPNLQLLNPAPRP